MTSGSGVGVGASASLNRDDSDAAFAGPLAPPPVRSEKEGTPVEGAAGSDPAGGVSPPIRSLKLGTPITALHRRGLSY